MISINISRALRAKTHFLLDILDDTGSKHVSHRCHHVHKEPICSFVRKCSSVMCLEMNRTNFQGYVVMFIAYVFGTKT